MRALKEVCVILATCKQDDCMQPTPSRCLYIYVHPAVLALEFDPMMMPTDDAMRWWTQMCGEGAHVAVAYVERLYFGELLAALLVRSKKKYSTDQEHHQV